MLERALFLGFALMLLPCVGWAQGGVAEHVRQLETSTDFRVRTQAALALGASGSKEALGPLCQGLADSVRTVRIAAASALGRLALGGKGCLTRRASVETEADVLASIDKALLQIDAGGGGGGEPAFSARTALYLAIDKLAGPARYDVKVRAAFVRAAAGREDVGFAPREEDASEALKLFAQNRKAKGYALLPKAMKPNYSEGRLEMKLSIAIMSYPERALVGNFSQTATMTGISTPDAALEEELLLAVAEAAMRKFLTLSATLP